ncbi:unnamed protein product [Prorocentrum cordatum]|uniref:Phosphoglycerate kinase n=1 Tax=Prorocentrum cordatum TaxID=2364126 RepID=A0ABN9X336_9DINO|nr:unnamed protein product [Polarella glacialis]
MLQVEGTSSLAQQIVPKGEFVGQALVEKALLGEPVFPDLVVIGECGGIDGEGLQEFENAAKAPTEAVADAEAQQKMEAARKRSWLATGEANHAAYVRAAAAEEAPLTEVPCGDPEAREGWGLGGRDECQGGRIPRRHRRGARRVASGGRGPRAGVRGPWHLRGRA